MEREDNGVAQEKTKWLRTTTIGGRRRRSAAGAGETSERREVSVRGVVRGIYTLVAVTGLKWAPDPVNL